MNDIYLENIDLNEKEFKEKRFILESKPTRIMVTLTNRCNFKCKMCRWAIRKKDLTLPAHFIEQIEKLFPYLDYIAWQGGEVFLVGYFKEIFKKIIQFPNIIQEITTNASLITEEWAELLSTSNTRLIVSIDSLNKDTYAYIREGGDLDDTIRNLSLISKARERNNKTNFFVTGLNIVVMRSNYKELESFVEFAQQYRFNFLNFMYLVDTLAPEEHIFEPLDLEALDYLRVSIPRIIERSRGLGINVCYEFEPILSNSYTATKTTSDLGCQSSVDFDNCLCRLPWMRLFISGAEEGIKVYPECICNIPVGELAKNSLEEIWNNEMMQLYRIKILNHTYNKWCNYRCIKGLVNKQFLQNR